MANPTEEVQKLVTEPIIDLIEFDFTSIGRGEHTYIASSYDSLGQPFQWGVNTYDRVDFLAHGFLTDLTGYVAEPTLTVAADTLFGLMSWPNLDLVDYRGVIVRRRRVFESATDPVQPQRYFIKKVVSFTATEITFSLTPSLGTERLNRASARKMEI